MEVLAKNCNQLHALKSTKTMISPVVKSRGARFLDMVRQSNLKTSPIVTNTPITVTEISLNGIGEPKTPIEKNKSNLESISENKFNPKSSPVSSKRRVKDDNSNSSPLMSNSTKVCFKSLINV